jgi:cation:H+ antiporter
VFAIAVLANRRMSVREAWMLFGLFISQFVLGGILPEDLRELERLGVGAVYLVLALVIFVRQRSALKPLVRDGLVLPVDELFHEESPDEARS